MKTFDYESVQAVALKSLTDLDGHLEEGRSPEELERDAHRFASVIVDVFNEQK
jgi:hypothetical protein